MKNDARPTGLSARIGSHFYDASKIDWDHLLFTKEDLRHLLVPLILEQLLSQFMGTMDSVMVSRVGEEAISAVSLADSINVLVLQIFAALAAGGTILCSQYLGHGDREKSNEAAKQLLLTVLVIAGAAGLLCFAFRRPLLGLIFGTTDPLVMEDAVVYFAYTSLSFPFIALYQAGAALFRAGGNSRLPMVISAISNGMNIAGNAVLIFAIGMGVAGAALSTLLSRIFCAVVILIMLRLPRQDIVVKNFLVRPNRSMITRLLAIGVPSGIENGMFQFGKLAIQSSVATLTVSQMAAQSMAALLEGLNGIGAVGVGIGLMTVVGQCMGAGRKEEAKYEIFEHMKIGEFVILLSVVVILLLTKPITMIGGFSKETADLCFYMMCWISIVKPIVWIGAFMIGYGIRAAGDVKWSMITSSITMWTCRVLLSTICIRVLHTGPIGVWIGMFSDWTLRAVLFSLRFRSGKWLYHKVI